MGQARNNRRAAATGRPTVRVSNRIDVIPMEYVESYYAHEIASEGKWAANVSVVIIQPEIDRGKADSGWFHKTLSRMREARRRRGTIPVRIGPEEAGNTELDVGLVDVTVFFEMPDSMSGLPGSRDELDRLLTENLQHFDSVCAGALHDQMVIAIAPHRFHSNGSHLFHYHNLILGLRQEVRGGMDILGPLDMDPLLKTLSRTGPLRIIGGMKPAL
jgi:hypothetical protein